MLALFRLTLSALIVRSPVTVAEPRLRAALTLTESVPPWPLTLIAAYPLARELKVMLSASLSSPRICNATLGLANVKSSKPLSRSTFVFRARHRSRRS